MHKRGAKLFLGVSLRTIIFCVGAALAQPAYGQQATAQQAADQPERKNSVSFSVPLVYNESVLGDVLIDVGADGVASFNSQSLRAQISALLNEAGLQELGRAIAFRDYVFANDLSEAGFELRFDENRLEVVIDSIAGNLRPISSLGQQQTFNSGDSLPTIDPADFSGYINFNSNFDYVSDQGVENPELFLFGVARYKNVVFELDGAVSDQFGPKYRFYRRSARAIYDQPGSFRRFSAGDLRINTLPLLQAPSIGGIAVEKRRQIFNPFLPISRLGGQEVYLDSRSTVNVLLNGTQFQTLQLEAGRYDLANIPLQTGSNNVELQVTDSAGRQQTIDLNYFFEPLDLEAGEEEYVASVGVISRDFSFEPDYSSDPVATAYYRRALSENFIVGGAAQISEDIQTFGAEATIVPQVIPGAFNFEFAASVGSGTGFASRAGYRLRTGNSFSNRKQFSLTVDYESKGYQTVGDIFLNRFDLFNLTGNYSQAFSEKTYASAGVTHSRRGGFQGTRTLVFADVIHRLNDRLRLTGGVEYGDDQFSTDNFGIRLGISMVFGGDNRVNADYRSRTGTTRAALSRGANNTVGSFGYDIGFTDSPDSTDADASFDYVANRFDARGSVFTSGGGFGSITDEQRVRLQIGSSIAFADGAAGIGRPISDSFAIVTPHASLDKRRVISGRDLSDNEYYARSGLGGGAVQSDLGSYSAQDVQYDVDGLQPGYDIGDGLTRVYPPYRSGYRIVVGNDRFVSALGNLTIGGQPASLISGTITSSDDEGFEPIPFFTNSVGRFGVLGLAPGKRYTVSIPAIGQTFIIEVPAENEGLYRLEQIDLSLNEKTSLRSRKTLVDSLMIEPSEPMFEDLALAESTCDKKANRNQVCD